MNSRRQFGTAIDRNKTVVPNSNVPGVNLLKAERKRSSDGSSPTIEFKKTKSILIENQENRALLANKAAGGKCPVGQVESCVRRLELTETKRTRSATKSIPSGTRIEPTVPVPLPAVAVDEKLIAARRKIDFNNPETYYETPRSLPSAIEDFDRGQLNDICSEPQYATDVFTYYRELEVKYALDDYMPRQTKISKAMRAVLVDWMVEVQESFELNHETLYLGVKLVDHYLSRVVVPKERFQLLGACSLFIAAKFDERIPPSIEDFLYICDDAYLRRDVIQMEMEVFKKLNYYIGFPISYRFLRRYARVAKLTMEQLTLARYILETSLMDYDVILEKDSKLAAAALLLAFRMKQISWTPQLEYYSGYEESELVSLMRHLNDLISTPVKSNKTVKLKYSHKIFFEVAKIAPLPPLHTN